MHQLKNINNCCEAKKVFIIFNFFISCLILISIINYFPSTSDNDEKTPIFILRSKCDCRNETISITKYLDEYENTNCDLYNVLRRGKHQKIISYSLYGTNKNRYYSQIKYIARLAAKYYPEWIMRIYYDKSIDGTIICELECLKDEKTGKYLDNVDFCNITEIPYGNPVSTWNAQYIHAANWRFFPIGDPFVDIFMSRDSDSWIVDREVEAVKLWLNSDKPFHIMRDHPHHGTLILAGMWAYANYRDRELGLNLYSLIVNETIQKKFNKNGNNYYGGDQDFLGTYIWPIAKNNSIIHDSFFCDTYGVRADPFPTQRPKVFCFVPCVHCCDEKVNNRIWPYECPEKCRPKEHKDWIYC